MKTIILAMGMAGLTVFGSAAYPAPTVYIPLGSGNQVIAVDGATDRILTSYPAVDNPHGLVATPDGEYLIAGSLVETPLPAGAAHDTPNSKLFLIHPQHGHVMRTVPVAGWSHHQAITPDGRYVLSTHPTRNAVSVLDLVGNKIVQTIATGAGPNYTLITRDGKRAYVSNAGDGTISELSIPGWTIARSFAGGPEPEHLTGSRDERLLYAISPKAGTIAEIVVADGKVKRTFPVGKNAHGLDISDDGKTLFASARGEDKLVAIDIASGRTRTLALAPAPYHLNTIHGAGKVYVSSSKKPVIWVVDQKSLKLVGTIALPAGEGHQMAVVE
ncbi:MAG TPA: YncE family protein [Acidiferrobacterales bacterium]|nr:YncE family protein [Acidiferrobacterales bacterium]